MAVVVKHPRRNKTLEQSVTKDESDVQNPLLELRLSHKSGLGLYTKSDIQRGTRIISEAALIAISTVNCKPQRLWKQLEGLSTAELDQFDSLQANVHFFDHRDYRRIHNALVASGKFGKHHELVKRRAFIESMRCAIWKTNAFSLGSGKGFAIFPLTARINHSCTPNVFAQFNPTIGKMTVHAIRDLKAGEEIVISYVDPAQPFEQRTNDLLARGITCSCDDCDWPSRKLGENIRNKLQLGADRIEEHESGTKNHNDAVPDRVKSRGLKDALAAAEERVALLKEAGLVGMVLASAHRQCSAYCLQLRMVGKARYHAEREQEVETYCLGSETEYLNDGRNAGNADCWMRKVQKMEQGAAAAEVQKNKHSKSKKKRGKR